jgi:GGDEF domain-containing protein
VIRAGDTAARIGGDEFVILLEQIEDVAQVREVAERISAGFGNCFVIGEHRVRLSVRGHSAVLWRAGSCVV